MAEKRLYRVIFQNQGKVYEIFARAVMQGNLFGFIELEDLVFGEKSQILVDPGEDSLRREFENTKRVFVPMHSVIRVDEMEQDSVSRPRVLSLAGEGSTPDGSGGGGGKVTPIYTPAPGSEPS